MPALFHIGPDDAEVLEDLRKSGLEVVSSDDERSTPDGAVDVVLIASTVEGPVHVARRIHAAAPDAHIVFLTTPERDDVLRRELLFGRIGTHWTIAPAAPVGAAAGAVRDAVQVTQRRRRTRTTIGRMNLRLAEPPPQSQRRALISDHFLASVLEQLPDAVVVLDPSREVLAFNSAAAAAFAGVRRGERFDATLPAAARDALSTAEETGSAETELHSPHGRDYGVRATALRDGIAGAIIGTAIVARELSDQRREARRRQLVASAVRELSSTLDARTAMKRLTDLFTTELVEAAAADVLTGSAVQRVAVSGRSLEAQRLLEGTANLELHRNVNHPSLAAINRGEIVVVNGVTAEQIHQLAINEEHERILLELPLRAFVVAPLRSSNRTVGAILLARTTTESFDDDDVATIEEIAREAVSALRNIWSYQAAEEASRMKDDFLATLSHELRTPMTSILGWSQILKLEEIESEMVREGLDSIERSARAQAQLIDDLLDLSRMRMGKLQFQARPFSVTSVVRGAIDSMWPAAKAKGVSLVFEESPEVTAIGDPDRMQQVIWNLVSNAVKFSESGREVTVRITVEAGLARIAVEDCGRGIAPEFLPQVFDRFRQADAATTRRFGGLGLGLAIVKQLVEMHGGTVEAASEGVGRGATFTITIPVTSAAPQAERAQGSAPRLADLSDVSILLVEDDLSSAATLSTILQRAGADVQRRPSAATALDELREPVPDVLISDVAMPDEDGLELIRAIRRTLRIPAGRLPAIALTAFTDVNLRVAVLGAGFQRFLTKPVEAEVLIAAVAALAGRS